MKLKILFKKKLLLLFVIAIICSCGKSLPPPEVKSPELKSSQKNERIRAQESIEELRKMHFTFDGTKPILEDHLNKKSLLTFIGQKFKINNFYYKKIENLGLEGFAEFIFENGIVKEVSSGVENDLTIRNHREIGGLLSSFGLISTSSSLEVACSFSKNQDVIKQKQHGIIIVVHSEEGTAIDINYIYKYYNVITPYNWDFELEFARIRKIPGNEIVGFYYIKDSHISNFYENKKSLYKWQERPNIEAMQEKWNKAPYLN